MREPSIFFFLKEDRKVLWNRLSPDDEVCVVGESCCVRPTFQELFLASVPVIVSYFFESFPVSAVQFCRLFQRGLRGRFVVCPSFRWLPAIGQV